jgi:hypothetical protein
MTLHLIKKLRPRPTEKDFYQIKIINYEGCLLARRFFFFSRESSTNFKTAVSLMIIIGALA